MLNPIQAAQKAKGFPSFGATAKALISQFPDKDWGLKPRSLETQIGKLDRGEATWWRNHPDAAETLAALLDLSLDDLGLHGDASANHLFNFTEFPGLKPLDFKREKPWQIGGEELEAKPSDSKYGKGTLQEWLDPDPTQWRPPYEMHWLCVTDALERRLLSRHLGATSPYKVVFTNTLAEANTLLKNAKPLIVVLEGDICEEDLNNLAVRPRNAAGLLVIAPCAMPVRQGTSSWEDMSWERFNLPEKEQRLFDLTGPGARSDIKRWIWRLQPNWRAAVLQWVEKRLLNKHEPDTLFDAQSLGDWLEHFDPLGQWFETSADLLHLCEIAHLKSEKKLPKPHDLDAGSKLTQLLFSDKSSPRGEQIKQLAQTRWSRLEFAWSGALPMSAWLSLLPANQLPPSAEDVRAIAVAKRAPERIKAAEHVISQLHEGNPTALRTSGLLKESADGQFDFEHCTLVRLIVRDQMMRQITDEPLSAWALACFDTERRPLVDAAFDAVSLDTLLRATKKLVLWMSDAADSASVVGTSEVLFIAIGRRIANREAIDDKFFPVLMQLAERVVNRLELACVEYLLPQPWSRPMQLPEQKLAWLSACWAWSLLPGAAPEKLADNWLFPGWSEALPEPPGWLTNLWPEEGTEQLSVTWQYFFRVADEWVKNWDQPIDSPPRLLKMALLERAAHGVWAADPGWWEDLQSRWAENVLLAKFKAAGQGAAVRLWSSYLKFEIGVDKQLTGIMRHYNQARLSLVRFWMLAQLSPAEGLADLTLDNLNYLASCPESLPPAFRAPLLLARAEFITFFDPLKDIAPFITRFGPSVRSALPELLTHDWLGSAAAQYLWAWDSAEAERLLCHDETLDPNARSQLFDTCPASKVGVAATLLFEKPTWFPAGIGSFWAQTRLPTAGMHAEVLMKIINRSSATNP